MDSTTTQEIFAQIRMAEDCLRRAGDDLDSREGEEGARPYMVRQLTLAREKIDAALFALAGCAPSEPAFVTNTEGVNRG